MVAIKEEVTSKTGSDQGEEEMEVDSADEKEEEARREGGQAPSQTSKNNTGMTFNTLSSLGSLRPGTLTLRCLFSGLPVCPNQSNNHQSTLYRLICWH